MRWSRAFLYQDWQSFCVARETTQPVAWDVKAAHVHLVKGGYPTDRTYWLIVAWNRQSGEYKYFLSNAPPRTALDLLLRVAFRRFKIEHLFRVAKGEVGLGHFEGRSYVGLMRHMILCQTVLLFLAQQAQRLTLPDPEDVPGPKDLPGPHQPPTHPVAPTPNTSERRGEKSAPHPGAVGHGTQWSLCPLA